MPRSLINQHAVSPAHGRHVIHLRFYRRLTDRRLLRSAEWEGTPASISRKGRDTQHRYRRHYVLVGMSCKTKYVSRSSNYLSPLGDALCVSVVHTARHSVISVCNVLMLASLVKVVIIVVMWQNNPLNSHGCLVAARVTVTVISCILRLEANKHNYAK